MAKSTIQFTGNVTRTVLMANNFVSNIRLTLVSVGLMLPQIRQYLFKFIMQVNDIHLRAYRQSRYTNIQYNNVAIRYH